MAKRFSRRASNAPLKKRVPASVARKLAKRFTLRDSGESAEEDNRSEERRRLQRTVRQLKEIKQLARELRRRVAATDAELFALETFIADRREAALAVERVLNAERDRQAARALEHDEPAAGSER